MDHLSALPLGCRLLDIYQQIHISHTHAQRGGRTLRHPVGPHTAVEARQHTPPLNACWHLPAPHIFPARHFPNEGHEIDPRDLRQIDPFPPLNLLGGLRKKTRFSGRRRVAHSWHRQIQFERKIYSPPLVSRLSAVSVCVCEEIRLREVDIKDEGWASPNHWELVWEINNLVMTHLKLVGVGRGGFKPNGKLWNQWAKISGCEKNTTKPCVMVYTWDFFFSLKKPIGY